MYIGQDTSRILSFAPVSDISSNSVASVVCSWPLSGQYGPGARALYYVLVVVCILAPHVEWMRGACLAAALLFPSIAAIHALIMTSIQQTRGPVDLDVFGCFQLCAIGVLAVPITIRYSKTYFETKGRNLVFMWTVLNLAGLVSLIVAFYRATPQPCIDSLGNNVTVSAFLAATDSQNVCSPSCSYWTLIRKDTTNASQWVLAPSFGMTFNTATLLCAACCIPAILSLVSVWQKVMHLTWIKRWRHRHDAAGDEGHGGQQTLTDEEQREQEFREDERWMDKKIRLVLGLVERIVFLVCILAIVILGEMNFWSQQMRYGVEPITSIGQWGPIVGAVLAVLGPLFTMMSSSADDASSIGAPDDEDAASPEGQNGSADPSPPSGHRATVNKGLFKVLKVLGTPGADRFADEVRTRKYRDYPLIPGEKERNANLEGQRSEFRNRRETVSRSPSFVSLHGPGALRTPQPSSPPSRVGSGADLAGQQARGGTERFLQVPTRSYTSPREATALPVRADTADSAYQPGPGLPNLRVDNAESDSDHSSIS